MTQSAKSCPVDVLMQGLQQLQMAGALIDQVNRSRTNTQHGFRSRYDLGPAGVPHQGSDQAETRRFLSYSEHFFFRVDLHNDLRLAIELPRLEGFRLFLRIGKMLL